MPQSIPSTLYVVATPIGNLDDMTFRGVATLKDCDIILAEDPAKTKKLLNHFDISTHAIRLPHAKDNAALQGYFDTKLKGKKAALVSDAGTPAISDPGSRMVRFYQELAENSAAVIPIPGASAVAAALSVAGVQTNPFVFLGFLSAKSARRRKELEDYGAFDGQIVAYESVHRIKQLVEDIYQVFGSGTEVFLAREMTKLYEDCRYIYAADELTQTNLKGEFVVVINNSKKARKLARKRG